MTIASANSRNDYTGNGATSSYPYTFKIFSASDLLVTKRHPTTFAETILVINTDYTVTGAGVSSGGNVVLSAALTNLWKLTIRRKRTIIQDTDLKNQTNFYPQTHEDGLDKLVMIDQQQQDEIDRSIKLPETLNPADFDMTLPATIADNALAMVSVNADGDGFDLAFVGDAVSVAQIDTAVAAADAAAISAAAASAAAFSNYRRPELYYYHGDHVGLRSNTGTANQTKIMFHDGNVRTVTEDIDASFGVGKYRICSLGTAAEFTSGTENSGLRAALTRTDNTWYAIYAVKSSIDSTKFVMVADTTAPLQANFATLNSAYGTNGWVYLGTIRNGDNDAQPGALVYFSQIGEKTIMGVTAVKNGIGSQGIEYAAEGSVGAGNLTVALSRGMGALQIPLHFATVDYAASVNFSSGGIAGLLGSEDREYDTVSSAGAVSLMLRETTTILAVEGGCTLTRSGASTASQISLAGWIDNVLAGGPVSQL